jgi:hypothetical protein
MKSHLNRLGIHEVQWLLDRLVGQRLVGPLSSAEQSRYDELAAIEYRYLGFS